MALFTIFVGIVVNMAAFSFKEEDNSKVEAAEIARFYVLDDVTTPFPENFSPIDDTSGSLVMNKDSGKCYRLIVERIDSITRLGFSMVGVNCPFKDTN